MSNAKLNDMIAAIQSQNRSLVFLIDDLKHKQQSKVQEVETLDKQLNRYIRLPYLVATVAEVFTLKVYNFCIGSSCSCRR